ncbi:sugar ABC transporter ATP-binding protein [Pseudonocardia lacus]|uniref:sugar ABC transporter ATP-binding protein n=1 Tax=Pseudonocardia lacus TaxID=2835865 RepID=UPI002027C51B|nr:sugar ABC transporter ATP-binding protein [Pseudonocardia lacus]
MTAVPQPGPDAAPLLEMTGISVAFGPVRALDGVDFRLRAGEVHALMGENGAGKSTLIKALTGVHPLDAGRVVLDGAEVAFSGPAQAQAAGISTVYQEVNLCPNLSVAENLLLGREPRRWGRIDGRGVRKRAREVLARLHLDVDPASPLGSHSIAVQQLVSIGRAVQVDCKVLILDEPTSSLDADEVAELFRVVSGLRAEGVAILFVTHFLDQVYAISDRTTVLRNGRLVGEYRTAELPRLQLVSAMVGRELEALEQLDRAPAAPAPEAVEPVVAASGLGRRGAIEPVDLAVRPGEVVGLAGLLGSGRTELARLLFGADRADTGQITIDGRVVPMRTPRDAIGSGVAFTSENRGAEGVVADLTVRDNIVLAMQAARGLRRIPGRTQEEVAARWIEVLDIRPPDPDALLRNLSGGNQQKVLLARWLATGPRLLILDEPTRGIDIGAKAQIQALVADLAGQGMAVVYISAELEEVVRLADRVLVLRDRRPVAELTGEDVEVDRVMELIATGHADPPGTGGAEWEYGRADA